MTAKGTEVGEVRNSSCGLLKETGVLARMRDGVGDVEMVMKSIGLSLIHI